MARLRKSPVETMLFANGPVAADVSRGHAWFRSHPFNVGQHVAHNEMLDECVRIGVDWHIRVDDDCFLDNADWLRRLLDIQRRIVKLTDKPAVLSPTINGLDNPPPFVELWEFGPHTIEEVNMLGGIFRMSPMSLMRYFRFDERLPMGFGEAAQFARYVATLGVKMYRPRGVTATHGGSTKQQKEFNRDWEYEHDMLQFIPLGL